MATFTIAFRNALGGLNSTGCGIGKIPMVPAVTDSQLIATTRRTSAKASVAIAR